MSKKGQQFPPRPRMKELRNRVDMSQDALGELIGANRSQIAKWERGEGALTDVRMRQIAKALNCQPWEIFEEAPLVPPDSPDLWSLLQLLEKFTPKQLVLLRDLATEILQRDQGQDHPQPSSQHRAAMTDRPD